MPPLHPSCSHSNLSFSVSPHALSAGYRPYSSSQLATAAGLRKGEEYPPNYLFPQPLVLPEDDLAQDPKQPPQSLRSWLRCKDRNSITPDRQTVYVAAPPEISPEVSFLKPWIRPHVSRAGATESPAADVNLHEPPAIEDILLYLSAFLHGLPVKQFRNPTLKFTRWSPSSRNRIALSTPASATLIRSRASPDHLFAGQLNLNDLIDAILAILPADAYALLLLVDHDIYEEESDVFVCGRAYGASRVAVVSTARYNPALDQEVGVDRLHAWPASHCTRYLEEMCASQPLREQQQQQQQQEKRTPESQPAEATERGATSSNPIDLTSPSTHSPPRAPLFAALQATTRTHSSSSSPALPHQQHKKPLLWHARVAKTTSHELLHCFALDHCVYHACVMQASASLPEDARQPPYLCPVDRRKLARAIAPVYRGDDNNDDASSGPGGTRGRTAPHREEEWVRARYAAVETACERLCQARGAGGDGGGLQQSKSKKSRRTDEDEGEGGGGVFAAFAAWIRGVMLHMKEEGEGRGVTDEDS